MGRESKTPLMGSLGLLRFDHHRKSDDLWKPFGESRFIIPKELRCENEPSPLTPLPEGEGDFVKTKSGEGWSLMVNQALAKIKSNQLQKVVLAQRQVLTASKPIDPIELFRRLKAYFPNTHHFFYEPEPGLAFIGASPEQLYKRMGKNIESEAQAGTRVSGEAFSKDLFENPKDHLEHQFVVDCILEVLEKLCLDFGITHAKYIAQLPNVQHLKTKLAGILKNGVTDQDILTALHPTPAVCGWPIRAAFEVIRQLENFDRGFYTGALGIIGEYESEFNVAIRGAVIKGCQLVAFAGAGIVLGSDVLCEQQEIENKMAFWRDLL